MDDGCLSWASAESPLVVGLLCAASSGSWKPFCDPFGMFGCVTRVVTVCNNTLRSTIMIDCNCGTSLDYNSVSMAQLGDSTVY